MGEYATYGGQQIKIGTCEDLYYLRFDQRRDVQPERGSVNPGDDETAHALRFRFPWPDEDHIAPGSGEFHDNGFSRAIAVHGFTAPADVEHGAVQFVAQAGYLASLPCPESPAFDAARIRVHRNGFPGAVQLVAQKWITGVGLVPILRCGGCGRMWREEDRARIEELAVCFRSEGDSRQARNDSGGAFWHAIADRILAGLAEPLDPRDPPHDEPCEGCGVTANGRGCLCDDGGDL